MNGTLAVKCIARYVMTVGVAFVLLLGGRTFAPVSGGLAGAISVVLCGDDHTHCH